ncbi:MAG: ATP-binding protein [Candidatus Cloacimonetes bacterium]|nr:ATP-binding protein [Candidatus Cloacimonadota bacterium]MCF7815151.1 ATP-binding protein [Candidatus Cloacimonadota bacterium]MCF7868016.1 ATP-binding protein [Candidatus Cloacimonadota bacterium]MCF7883474.1 ATP-binding protein [Candidatus Cloacimonadota bacterium]
MQYYHRLIETEIKKQLAKPEAIFILGARQVGKTSLMKHLMSELTPEEILYMDLENPENLTLINAGINEFLNFLQYKNSKHENKKYIFIDEIQYAADFSSLIKYMVDHYSDKYKFILSGSSSLQIRKQFQESLVGRKIIFELYPLNFTEFCRFKEEDHIADILIGIDSFKLATDPLRFARNKVQNIWQEFLIFGGFPKAVLQNEKKDKIRVLQDIVNSYIFKDIRHIFNLEKVDQFNHLIKLLAVFTGKQLNFSQLATESRLHKQSLEHYINALESGYIIKLIKPFHRNLSSELRKTPKCYFIDNGLRNCLINNFTDTEFRTDRGEILENYIFSQLIKRTDINTKLNYWRTKNKQEIDFIWQKENQLFALESKWNQIAGKNLKKFVSSYKQAETFTISFSQELDMEKHIIPGYLI